MISLTDWCSTAWNIWLKTDNNAQNLLCCNKDDTTADQLAEQTSRKQTRSLLAPA